VESFGEAHDLFLRAVQDLYTRWLSDSTYRQQAQVAWQQQRERFIERVGRTAGDLFEKLSKIGGVLTEPIGSLVKGAFDSLVAANQTLASGGIQVSRLQYEQARDIVKLVAEVSGHPITIVLDQWDKSPSIGFEESTLDAFLRHLDDWPLCHVFIAIRPEPPAFEAASRFQHSHWGTAELFKLGLMRLEDLSTQQALLAFLREKVPATKAVDDDGRLCQLVDGYPGVVGRWSSDYQASHMKTPEDLESVASQAKVYQYLELDTIGDRLSQVERLLAVRLALVTTENPSRWDAIKEIVLGGRVEAVLDDLKQKGMLESVEPPSFGPTTRREAARRWFVEHRRSLIRQECLDLIRSFSGRVKNTDWSAHIYAEALGEIASTASELKVPSHYEGVCYAAIGMFGRSPSNGHDDLLIRAAKSSRQEADAPLAPLLAMGLLVTLYHAKAGARLEHADELLDQLRQLAQSYPQDADVRRTLAHGLKVLIAANAERQLERRDVLLAELRQLAQTYPLDTDVRKTLAEGLFSALIDGKAEEPLEHDDVLLEELLQLAQTYPHDATVRWLLAEGLLKTLKRARAERRLGRRDVLLAKLRQLVQTFPQDSWVAKWLAEGLFSTLIDGEAEGQKLESLDVLLAELRQLAQSYPRDPIVPDLEIPTSVREWLAQALLSTLNRAGREGARERRDVLLSDLRQLAQTYPQDAFVRARLAKGIFNTLNHAQEDGRPERRDALLAELWRLVQTYPQDNVAPGLLAEGLFNALVDGKVAQQELERSDALLAQLRQLAQMYSQNASVPIWLAAGLFRILSRAQEEGALKRRDDLLAELRQLAQTNPENGTVRITLARGLLVTFIDARQKQQSERQDTLLVELRALAETYPEDADLHEVMVTLARPEDLH
jgi:hypothetical protein